MAQGKIYSITIGIFLFLVVISIFFSFALLSRSLESPSRRNNVSLADISSDHLRKNSSQPPASRDAGGKPPLLLGPTLDAIIAEENNTPTQTAHRLFEALSQLDEDSQRKAVEYAVLLADDLETENWVRRLISNEFSDPIADILYQKLLTLEEPLKLHALAEIADQRSHYLSEQSTEVLASLFDTPSNGMNWVQWIDLQSGRSTPH